MTSPIHGDMSRHFQSLAQSATIKTRLATLTQELSSGRIADLATHLRGNVSSLATIDREIETIDARDRAGQTLSQTLDHKQSVLTAIGDGQTTLAGRLIALSTFASPADIARTEDAGRDGFDRVVGLLNTRFADLALFAGSAVDAPAVASADNMLADLLTAIGGASDAAVIAATINDWFDVPTGGYAMTGYLGDTGNAVTQRVTETETITLTGRADDADLRDMLKASAYAAVSHAMSGTLDQITRLALLRQGGEMIFDAADGIRGLAARIGDDQQRLEELSARRSAQRTTFATARNNLVNADPYDTASALQSVQQQLELHYTATARLSRLSLANYL
ncbi:flagellar hook-associated protein 3 FlgL [Loktanella fryxellensis]|uniref:Flagellar hook-associated protein 3 FlgL n=1 Tax=Loktanella fryxellensis TaxID=245187 RepID=A0A1H7ZN87_9RHOB|nr:flagellin [Loktanella fryxellensis]SEM59733.1 flagellar hook-associated protein 3 FlgL [Loktanella fryxellensis]